MDLIFTKHNIILSSHSVDWSVLQKKFIHYKASLQFDDMKEVIDYLVYDYNLSVNDKNILEKKINEKDTFYLLLQLSSDGLDKLNIQEINSDILENQNVSNL